MPRSICPSSISARPRSGAPHCSSCAIPCVRHSAGEFVVDPADLFGLSPRQVDDRAEEEREGERLWMFERARFGHRVAHHLQPLIRKSPHRQGSGEFAAAEDARIDTGFPHARLVKLGLIQLETRGPGGRGRLPARRGETRRRRASTGRPSADSGSPRRLNRSSISKRHVASGHDFARDDVVGADKPIRTGTTRAGSSI